MGAGAGGLASPAREPARRLTSTRDDGLKTEDSCAV
jgi:hypothetical protein